MLVEIFAITKRKNQKVSVGLLKACEQGDLQDQVVMVADFNTLASH
jgi:hypothetical protein